MPDDGANNSGKGQGDPDQSQDGGKQGAGGKPAGSGTLPETFEAFIEGQPQEVQGLYESDVNGLKSALKSERDEKRDIADKLRDATAKLEEGSETRQELEKLTERIDEAERRTGFYEEAAGQGVNNLRLAYLAASEADLFDRRGNVDFGKLKELHPELYDKKATVPKGNAGAGAGQGGSTDDDMNSAIRRAAGRE